jgi:hypothetical protein
MPGRFLPCFRLFVHRGTLSVTNASGRDLSFGSQVAMQLEESVAIDQVHFRAHK